MLCWFCSGIWHVTRWLDPNIFYAISGSSYSVMQHHTQENIIPHWTLHTQFRNHEQAVLFPHLHQQLKNIHLKLSPHFTLKCAFQLLVLSPCFGWLKGPKMLISLTLFIVVEPSKTHCCILKCCLQHLTNFGCLLCELAKCNAATLLNYHVIEILFLTKWYRSWINGVPRESAWIM